MAEARPSYSAPSDVVKRHLHVAVHRRFRGNFRRRRVCRGSAPHPPICVSTSTACGGLSRRPKQRTATSGTNPTVFCAGTVTFVPLGDATVLARSWPQSYVERRFQSDMSFRGALAPVRRGE